MTTTVHHLPLIDHVSPPRRPWIFAIEDHAIQVTWRTLGPGRVRFRAADTTVEVETDGGPGSVVLDGLPAATRLQLRIEADGPPVAGRRQWFRTMPSPPGEEVFRFATISDLHIGEFAFGFFRTMLETPVPAEAHPVRATRAAIAELTAWGAELILVKGDLTANGRAKDFDMVGRLFANATIPFEMMPGNHDQYGRVGDPDPTQALALLGHAMTDHVEARDVPGLRLVLVDSTEQGQRLGHVRLRQHDVVDALASSPTPAFVTLHHYAQRLPFPTFWPPGISTVEAKPFLRAIAHAQPATMVSSGHTHRHRRRHVGPLVLTEVGSTKDYPGTWAGYVVHEGGIRQVVRRVAAPDVLAWTDFSAGAAFAAWGLWSPGLLSHRCFTHVWPTA